MNLEICLKMEGPGFVSESRTGKARHFTPNGLPRFMRQKNCCAPEHVAKSDSGPKDQ
eukprot:CAMPEP_0184499798 /NCGR_PEP_ID=MMETSP0113_2-20130426/42543_1 /TAXON_ID=91329 /ORGANISM="Norrisiella sphaerica, Strain BC52" /LENGTH=56 /DNA_ID=CAMNT_0026887849 /DNA_START=66 /DNA_END=233 /DNA_ORIENTATION=-